MKIVAGSWLISIIVMVSFADAELYKWVDKNGSMHFSDRRPEDNSIKVEASVDTIKGQESLAESIQSQNHSPVAEENLYTEEQKNEAIQKTEASILRSETTCKTDKHTNSRDQAWWDNYCDELARGYKATLDVLLTNPNRYFYVIKRKNQQARGEAVFGTPRYTPWW